MNRGEKILNEISKGEMILLREKKQQCSERRLDGERRRIRKKEGRRRKEDYEREVRREKNDKDHAEIMLLFLDKK
jgi:hypothetical protein